jgi:hypothetical protein
VDHFERKGHERGQLPAARFIPPAQSAASLSRTRDKIATG